MGGIAALIVAALSAAIGWGAQKGTQKHQEEREDSAYQRMVQDMNAAGLNPLLYGSGAKPTSQEYKGSKRTGFEAAMQGLTLAQMRADVSKTNAEKFMLEAVGKKEGAAADLALRTIQGKAEAANIQSAVETMLGKAKLGPRQLVIQGPEGTMQALYFHDQGMLNTYREELAAEKEKLDQNKLLRASQYEAEAFKQIMYEHPEWNPALVRVQAGYIGVEMARKDLAWYVPRAIGSMLGGATSGVGAAAIKAAMVGGM